MEFLIDRFNKDFFNQPIESVIREYKEVISVTLGKEDPYADHIRALHRLGYIPLKIYAVPEGTFVPSGCPEAVIINTHPDFFWLPNYIETMLSNACWLGSTSATTATVYRQLFMEAAKEWGETDFSFVDRQGHDFSYRGMGGLDAAITSGMGHLLSFSGTDTLPAILGARHYYNMKLERASIDATEHSVVCAGGEDTEFETIKRLLTDVYPTGDFSYVSDTWNFWRVLTDYLPRLKEIILARDGMFVVRPDSGDPPNILCGDPSSSYGPERAGALWLLRDTFGCDNGGHLNKVATVYGDSITPERGEAILRRTVREVKMSPYNVALGIGSFTYQHVTRDTHGRAVKATAIDTQEAGVVPIFKDPITDHGDKKSHKGIPLAVSGSTITTRCTLDETELDMCLFRLKFADSRLVLCEELKDIRSRTRSIQWEALKWQ